MKTPADLWLHHCCLQGISQLGNFGIMQTPLWPQFWLIVLRLFLRIGMLVTCFPLSSSWLSLMNLWHYHQPACKKQRTMHELPWITIFVSRVRRFANNFHEWRSHEWKLLANRITSDPKSLFTVTNVLFYFLHVILCPWMHNSTKNNWRLPTSPLSLRTVFSDLSLWRHYSWSVTSCKRRLLALWRRIRRLFLYTQIGAKVIFTSE